MNRFWVADGSRSPLRALLRALARLTDPDANRSAEGALKASRARVSAALAKDSGDDWRTTGDDLEAALRMRRPCA